MGLAEVHREKNSQDIPALVDCGCTTTLWNDGSGIEIEYCPKHKAAPELLEALKLARPIIYYIRRHGWDEAPPFGSAIDEVVALTKTDEAIAKVEGEK